MGWRKHARMGSNAIYTSSVKKAMKFMSHSMDRWTRSFRRGAQHSDPARTPRFSRQIASPESQARAIQALMQAPGTWERSFALYLSSRIDLLPAEYCRELAQATDTAQLLPLEFIERVLTQELSVRLDQVFAEINHAQAFCTLVSQSVAAKLRNGAPVYVVVLRPEHYAWRAPFDTEFMRGHFAELRINGDVIDDFLSGMRRKTDFIAKAEAIERLYLSSRNCAAVAGPRIYRELCTDRVMVIERLYDSSVQEFLQSRSYGSENLAFRLCQAWLRLAIFGKQFPVDAPNVRVLENGELWFEGSDLVSLSQNSQNNLWKYLVAASSDRPDEAAGYLLREMSRNVKTPVDGESFRSGFRQAADFGILEPILGTNSNTLPHVIFQHWKTALENGYQPAWHLLSFYRGLFSVARLSRTLAPLRDPLRESLEDLRSALILDQIQNLEDWRYVTQNLDKFATALLQLPSTFDDALTCLSTQEQVDRVRKSISGPGPRNESLMVSIAVFLLAAAVFAAQFPVQGVWVARLAPLGLMLAGLLILRRFCP